MQPPQRDKRFWTQICAEYRRGGQTRPALAAKYDVNESTLNYHLSKANSRARTAMEFVPVQVAASAAQVAVVEIALRGGVVVRAEVGTDVEYVARLVRALQG
jgi:transposase-like protein